MAFTTGSDFLTGILAAQNSGDVFDQNTNTRYGERIGDDGFLRIGPFTTDFLDSDGDGIDDRHQAGAGQPEIGSKPDESPIFDGAGNPTSGGSGGGGGENSPSNDAPQDSYDMNPDGTITQYDASTGETTTYNYNDPDLSFPQQFFGTAMTAANMVPTTGSLISGIIKSLYDRFNPSEDDTSETAAALSLLGPSSYESLNTAAIENSLENAAFKNEVNALAEIDPALRDRLSSFGTDLSIGDYNTALSEVTPTDFSNLSLTTNDPLGAYREANSTNEHGNTASEQNAINDAVNNGTGIGYGYNSETDNFAGLVTTTNRNTNKRSNVRTGYNETMANSIRNPDAVAAIRGRHMRDVQRGNRDTSEGGNRGGPGDSSAPGGSAAAGGNRGGAPGARS
tara:strand:+ start:36 stop:1220 length:1185 start_codon:yes stop_codon:yes gene_type:complete